MGAVLIQTSASPSLPNNAWCVLINHRLLVPLRGTRATSWYRLVIPALHHTCPGGRCQGTQCGASEVQLWYPAPHQERGAGRVPRKIRGTPEPHKYWGETPTPQRTWGKKYTGQAYRVLCKKRRASTQAGRTSRHAGQAVQAAR
jgi:hypothetical protein